MSEIGTCTTNGVVTCALCGWSGWLCGDCITPAGALTLHRIDAHPETVPHTPEETDHE